MQNLASKYTVGTLDSVLSVENGDSVVVYDIRISNASISAVEVFVQETEGNTILKIPVGISEDNEKIHPFLASKGIQLAVVPTVGSDITATVFHSHGGA